MTPSPARPSSGLSSTHEKEHGQGVSVSGHPWDVVLGHIQFHIVLCVASRASHTLLLMTSIVGSREPLAQGFVNFALMTLFCLRNLRSYIKSTLQSKHLLKISYKDT